MAMVKTIIALVTVAAVLPAAAFDWKAKPIAELKADLVAYARKVGESNLADRVEKSVGAGRSCSKQARDAIPTTRGASMA